MSPPKRTSKSGRPVDKLARRLGRKEKRRTARKQQKQERRRLEAEKREVDEELLLLAALQEEEEAQDSSHACVPNEDLLKCEYCQCQGRDWFNGVEACHPVPVKDNNLARCVVVRHLQFVSNPGDLQARRLEEAAKTLDYSMRERKASPKKKQVGEEQEDNGGEDGFRVCGADFRLLRTVKCFVQTSGGANFVQFMHGVEAMRDAPEEGEGDRACTLREWMRSTDLSDGHMRTLSPSVEEDECESPPSVVKLLGRAVGCFF